MSWRTGLALAAALSLGSSVAVAQDNGEDPAAIAACKDTANHIYGFRVGSGYSYYYNGYAAPANVASVVPTYLWAGTVHASQSFTDCSVGTVQWGPTPHSLGATSRFPQMSVISQPKQYACLKNGDGFNERGWLSNHTPGAALAVTCIWWDKSNGIVIESDMVYNQVYRWFGRSPPTVCASSYDLQGVATHETLHTYGINHADYGTTNNRIHDNLTMNSATPPCTTSHRTLGLGDLYAMQRRY